MDAVLVVVPWAAGSGIPFLAGPLEVVGELRLGVGPLSDGALGRIRIVLDSPAAPSGGGRVP